MKKHIIIGLLFSTQAIFSNSYALDSTAGFSEEVRSCRQVTYECDPEYDSNGNPIFSCPPIATTDCDNAIPSADDTELSLDDEIDSHNNTHNKAAFPDNVQSCRQVIYECDPEYDSNGNPIFSCPAITTNHCNDKNVSADNEIDCDVENCDWLFEDDKRAGNLDCKDFDYDHPVCERARKAASIGFTNNAEEK